MHSSSGRVSRGVQKNDRWNSRFLTGYRFRSVTAACRYRAPWTTGWSADRQSRREFVVQRSVQYIDRAFCLCHVHSPFRFFVYFYCSTVLSMRKAHVSPVLHCNSAYIVLSINKEKVQKTCVFCTLKAQILISAWWTAERDERLWDRTHLTLIRKVQYSCGFSGFPLSVNP